MKHIGMSYEMFMKMPIQDRRAFIARHNMEQDAANREHGRGGDSTRTYEGDAVNTFAKMEQSNRGGH